MPGEEGAGQDGRQAPDATDGGEQSGGGERTFTQSELNAIVGDRVGRERQKFADYDSLKAAKTELDALKAEQMSELEKAQARAAEAEAARDQALVEANDRLIRAAFVAEAAKAGAAHPEDAFALADLATISIADDGKVVGAGEAVKALVDNGRLVMAARPQAPNLDGGAGGGGRPGDTQALTPEQLEMARKLGVKPEDYIKYIPKKK